MSFLKRLAVALLLNAAALWVADWIFDGVRIDGWVPLLIGAGVFALINTLLKPVLVVLAIPLILVTLGIFLLVINMALLGLTDWIVSDFDIEGFWTYVGTVVVVWLVNTVLENLLDLD